MFKRSVSTIVIAVLFILSIGYPRNVMAQGISNSIFSNEDLFNITSLDTKWIEDENTYAEPGYWQSMEERGSYIIESGIERYINDDIEEIDATVIFGKAAKDIYDESCSTISTVKQTMYEYYFSNYIGEAITVTDCSDKGYAQLFYGKCKGNQDGYFDSTQVFYGIAKGYFVSVVYTASMEKSDSISEEWFTNVFYKWIDKIPTQGSGGNLGYIQSFVWIEFAIIGIFATVVVIVVIILLIQQSKRRKKQKYNFVSQSTSMPEDIQTIDIKFKFCTSCGRKTELDSKFCSKCGTNLD